MSTQPIPIPAGAIVREPERVPIPAGATVREVPIPAGATVAGAPSADKQQPPALGLSDTVSAVAGAMPSVGPITPGVLLGAGKAALETVRGAAELGRKVPVFGGGAPMPEAIKELDLEPKTPEESVGAFGEQVAEFAGGGEIFKGAQLLAKVPRPLLALIERYPKATKLLTEMAKSATVGGAQGGVKGAAKGQTTAGAAGGAVGGALGEVAGAGITAGLKPLAKFFGVGGLTAEAAMQKSARPYVGEMPRFKESVERAMPTLVKLKGKFKTLDDFVDLVQGEANDLWTGTVVPQIARNADAMVDVRPVAQRIRESFDESARKLFPDEAKIVDDFAKQFEDWGMLSLKEADAHIHTLNAKLAKFYKMDPASRHAAGATDESLAKMEAAADGLREQVYRRLEELGEPTPAEFRKLYGALKDVGRVFGKRATVSGRQAPISFMETMGLMEAAAAFFTGHPVAAVAGAVPFVTKARSTPESLLKQGLKAATATGPGATRQAVAAMAPAAGAAAGQAAALPARSEGMVRFRASDGSIHDVPADQLEAAKKIDPELEVIE